jgi:hypothetical protein
LFILKFIDSSFYKEQNRKVSSLIYDFLIIPSNLAKYKEKYYTLKIYPQIINNNIRLFRFNCDSMHISFY